MSDLLILGIPGSLRAKSYSRSLLVAAQELAPAGSRVEIAENRGFPVYNQDEEGTLPEPVRALQARVRAADAVLFAINEHNFGLSAAEKNVIDWVSRPPTENAWNGKPAGLMSASVGMVGGVRAQYELRRTMVTLNLFPINRPEVIVPFVHQKIDAEGRLTDETARTFIAAHVAELVRYTRVLTRPP